MLSPRPAGSTGKTSPIRVNPDFLTVLRDRMLEKLEPRLRVQRDESGEARFADPNFVRQVGRGLEKVSDSLIIHAALMRLDEDMRSVPVGQCGIPLIDDITAGDHLDDNPKPAEAG